MDAGINVGVCVLHLCLSLKVSRLEAHREHPAVRRNRSRFGGGCGGGFEEPIMILPPFLHSLSWHDLTPMVSVKNSEDHLKGWLSQFISGLHSFPSGSSWKSLKQHLPQQVHLVKAKEKSLLLCLWSLGGLLEIIYNPNYYRWICLVNHFLMEYANTHVPSN